MRHNLTQNMLRLLVALALVLGCTAFSPATGAALQLSKVAASRADASVMMAAKKVVKKAAAKKAVAKKAAPKPAPKPKPAPAKKVVAKKSYGKSPKGKGGIFPWITNEPGSANPARTHVQAVCRRCRRLLQPPAAAAAAAARAPLMLRRGRGRIAAQMLRKLSAAS